MRTFLAVGGTLLIVVGLLVLLLALFAPFYWAGTVVAFAIALFVLAGICFVARLATPAPAPYRQPPPQSRPVPPAGPCPRCSAPAWTGQPACTQCGLPFDAATLELWRHARSLEAQQRK